MTERMPRLAVRFALLVLAAAALASCSGSARAQGDGWPDDLRIELRSVPRLPGTVPGEHSVVIDAAGNARLSAVEAPTGPLPAVEARIPPEGMADIWRWIQKERFFELKPLYEDPDVQDGDFAEMTITADGRTHRVRTVNIRVYAFDRIAVVVGYYLPKGRRIQYNALNFPTYKSIER